MISSALPIPSIKPSFFAVDPDQNSPVNKSGLLSFLILFDLLSSTTFIKSECNSNCIFFNLSTSSFFSSTKGSKVLLFLPAV